MRCPKCYTETPADAAVCPGCKLATPRGKYIKNKQQEQKFRLLTKRKWERPKKSATKKQGSKLTRVAVLAVGSVVAIVFGLGCYYAVSTSIESKHVDPKTALSALNQLRRLPSSQEGLNIDQYFEHEVKRYSDSGKLGKFHGWSTRLMNGNETQLFIIFSFEEKDGTEHKAEWLADTAKGSFAPQTELAASIQKH